MIYLRDLAIGDKAKVIGYSSSNASYRKRLLVMGLTPGTEVKVVGIAPLGDPIQIYLRGSSICLRRQEANILQLEKLTK